MITAVHIAVNGKMISRKAILLAEVVTINDSSQQRNRAPRQFIGC
jgi:hypothetical protein